MATRREGGKEEEGAQVLISSWTRIAAEGRATRQPTQPNDLDHRPMLMLEYKKRDQSGRVSMDDAGRSDS